MGSLGETLRQARLDRGVSLLDAEQETHIRRRYLEALEMEDYAVLPATVYARGFVRTYARYLGLDPEATLDLYVPGRSREDHRAQLRPATPQMQTSRPIPTTALMVVSGVVLLGLLLAYIWVQLSTFNESQSDTGRATQVPGRPAAVASAVPGAAVASPGSVAAKPSPPANTPLVQPPPERGIVLEARVTDRTWMEVWVDGTQQLQTTLQGGTSRTFAANQSIRMRVGNAGAVQVTVNGASQGTLGDRNQVKELVWER
jgi:cytoskeletal protein RodZ